MLSHICERIWNLWWHYWWKWYLLWKPLVLPAPECASSPVQRLVSGQLKTERRAWLWINTFGLNAIHKIDSSHTACQSQSSWSQIYLEKLSLWGLFLEFLYLLEFTLGKKIIRKKLIGIGYQCKTILISENNREQIVHDFTNQQTLSFRARFNILSSLGNNMKNIEPVACWTCPCDSCAVKFIHLCHSFCFNDYLRRLMYYPFYYMFQVGLIHFMVTSLCQEKNPLVTECPTFCIAAINFCWQNEPNFCCVIALFDFFKQILCWYLNILPLWESEQDNWLFFFITDLCSN